MEILEFYYCSMVTNFGFTMQHFRDITSFHSIGKVIDGKPEHQNNVIDLLNFLSQVVFCDRIAVSILGPKEITEGTLSVINKLELLGIPQGLIDKYSYPDSDERILQRNRISRKLTHEWLLNFPELSKTTKESFPPGYYDMLNTSVDIFSDALLSNRSKSQFESEISESLNDDKISYMVGLLLSDEDLSQVVRHNFRNQNAGREELFSFIAMARNKYNLLLSEDLKLAFTPSASRAIQNQNTAYSLMESYQKELNKDPREEMKNLRLTGKEFQLSIPSALHLLLAQRASSVTELIDRALEARDKLSWYREEVLSDFNRLRFSDDFNDQIKLTNLLDSTYSDVASILSTNKKSIAKSLFGHFSIDLSGFSGVSGSGTAIANFLKVAKNWNQYRQRKDCYLLTQELIHHMSRSNNDYEVVIQELFIALGGSFSSLIESKLLK